MAYIQPHPDGVEPDTAAAGTGVCAHVWLGAHASFQGTATRNAHSNPDSASLSQKSPTWLRAYRTDVSSPAYSQLLSEGAVHQPAAV